VAQGLSASNVQHDAAIRAASLNALAGDGATTLRGAVADRAELYGLLAKVRDLGTALILVRTLDGPDQARPPGVTRPVS
jgi:hypothetical protein